MGKGRISNEALADRIAAEMAKGASQAEAWRLARPIDRDKEPQYVAKRSSEFCIKWDIRGRVRRLRASMRLSDIYSVQAWLKDSLDQRDAALADKNYNAAGGYQRQIGQAVGAIGSDTNTVILAHQIDDKAIIERLAAGDPKLAEALATKLGGTKPDNVTPIKKAS